MGTRCVLWGALLFVAGCSTFVGVELEDGTTDAASSTTGPEPVSSSTTTTSDLPPDSTGALEPGTSGETSTTGSTSGVGTSTGGVSDESSSSGGPVLPGCANGEVDVNETDVDCGGPCPACEAGASCEWFQDCASASCIVGVCGASELVVWLDSAREDTVHQSETCDLPAMWDGDAVQCWQNLGLAGDALVAGTGDDVLGTSEGVVVDGSFLLIDSPFDDQPLGDVWIVFVSTLRSDTNSFDLNLAYPSESGPGRYSAHLPWAGNQRLFWDPSTSNRVQSAPDLIGLNERHLFGLLNSQSVALRAIQVDGTAVATAEDGVAQATADFAIGRGADIAVHEVRVYAPAPTGAERQQIEGELACKWDLRDQLPATHPYYSAAGDDAAGCEPFNL